MSVRVHKPTTPGRRKSSVSEFKDITKSKPEKSLVIAKRKRTSGRNNQGRISVYQRGGGHKRKLRIVDFKQIRFGHIAKVEAIEYDPNRSANVALIKYDDSKLSYILSTEGLKVGDEIESSDKKIEIKNGNRMPLQYVPAGIMISNVEYTPKKGGQIIKSAGASATVMGIEGNYAKVRLPSGEIRNFNKNCLATIGQVSNYSYRNVRLGKAGRTRWLGKRPKVRGKAKNPVDHPHGGGEGAQPIGMKHPKTRKGKPALGVKTRKLNKKSDKFIIKRRSKRSRR